MAAHVLPDQEVDLSHADYAGSERLYPAPDFDDAATEVPKYLIGWSRSRIESLEVTEAGALTPPRSEQQRVTCV